MIAKDIASRADYSRISLLFAALAAGLAFFLFTGQRVSLAVVLGFVLLLVGSVPLVLDTNRDILRPINLFVFWFLTAIGLRGITDLYSNDLTWLWSYDLTSPHYHWVMSLVFLYSIIALLSLFIGYYIQTGDKIASILPRMVIFSRLKSKITPICIVYLCIGVIGALLIFRNAGWFEGVRTPAGMIARTFPKGGQMHLHPIAEFLTIGFLILLINRYGKKRGITEKLLLALFFGLSVIGFLIGGMKGGVLKYVVYICVAHHYLKKRLSLKTCLLFFLVLVVLIPFLHSFRIVGGIYHLKSAINLYSSKLWNNPAIYYNYSVGRSAGADHFFLIIDKTPEVHQFELGRNLFVRIATAFFPRPLWPDKPFAFGIDYGKDYLGDFLGLSVYGPSMIGELYINFHIIGIVVGFFLIGIYLRVIDSYCLRRDHIKEGVLLYCVLATRMVILVDGDIVAYFVFTLIGIFPIVFTLFLSDITHFLGFAKLKSRF